MNATTGEAAALALQQLLHGQRARVVAHLARALGLAHLALAEDAVQSASLKALQLWPLQGLPHNPAGWMCRVAQRAALDMLRAQQRDLPWPEQGEDGEHALPTVPPPAGRFAGELDDEQLALLFAACHPALPAASQVALALRPGAGREPAPIAAGLLCSEAALAQRLARARRQLAEETLGVPAGDALPPRRDAVLTVLALAFHAGARERARGRPIAGGDALQLCWEAIRLARALAAHPAAAHADADALAAMLLLHGARLTGQLDAAGDIVPLAFQPRERWDAGMVRLGFVHLQRAQRGERLSRWHLQGRHCRRACTRAQPRGHRLGGRRAVLQAAAAAGRFGRSAPGPCHRAGRGRRSAGCTAGPAGLAAGSAGRACGRRWRSRRTRPRRGCSSAVRRNGSPQRRLRVQIRRATQQVGGLPRAACGGGASQRLDAARTAAAQAGSASPRRRRRRRRFSRTRRCHTPLTSR